MGVISGEEPPQWEAQGGGGAHDEKILVSVRLRPLSEKEIAKNDAADWECINETTVIFKNALPERSMYPPAYTFDRVFGCETATKQVYLEGAKKVALSVLDGINSSIFAYGQTSSGKTYTMSGITEYSVADIYDYIDRHKNREYNLKFSAMEIYNEAVRDLLSPDATQLRLLDDPERGTIVEKLTEVTLRDRDQLMELLYICEAQRQIGETSLNETSSRSHQILRLMIESSARDFTSAKCSSTLSATVNFVDLAGSERASQTMSAGARLKEGCHINRSLLTLGTVIRKLSKGRNAHVPYRDSKLTRILQSSLGGNARTAIICTMSPAHSHVEQSRNTLLFASCAREVSTKAQVNVVMSDKTLVKHLQVELARMENELRSLSSPAKVGDSAALLLKERELQIEKMNKEIQNLTRERDLAQSRVEDLLQSIEANSVSELEVHNTFRPRVRDAWKDEYSASESSDVAASSCIDEYPRTIDISQCPDSRALVELEKDYLVAHSSDDYLLDGSSPQLLTPRFCVASSFKCWEIGNRANEDSEDHCKEVLCIETEESRANESTEADALPPVPEEMEEIAAPKVRVDEENSFSQLRDGSTFQLKDDKDLDYGEDIHILKHKIQEMQKTIDCLSNFYPLEASPCSTEFSFQSSKHSRSRSCNAIIGSPWCQRAELDDRTPTNRFTYHPDARPEASQLMRDEVISVDTGKLSRKNSEASMQGSEAPIQCSESSHQSSESFHQSVEASDREAIRMEGFGEQNVEIKAPSDKASDEENIGTEAVAEQLIETKAPDEEGTSIKTTDLEFMRMTAASEEAMGTKKSDEVDTRNKTCDPGTLPTQVLNNSERPAVNELGENEKHTALDKTQIVQSPSSSNWIEEFETRRREILELWDACHIPLVHRTYFFLLFTGEPSDSVYIEVELRRLSFLKEIFNRGTRAFKDDQSPTLASRYSERALKRERETLSKRMLKRFSRKEMEDVYQKWGIGQRTKQRRLQLAHRLWTDTKDMEHVKQSASVVAKLVGFASRSDAPKEMFGLSFLPQQVNKKSYGWKQSMSGLL